MFALDNNVTRQSAYKWHLPDQEQENANRSQEQSYENEHSCYGVHVRLTDFCVNYWRLLGCMVLSQ